MKKHSIFLLLIFLVITKIYSQCNIYPNAIVYKNNTNVYETSSFLNPFISLEENNKIIRHIEILII